MMTTDRCIHRIAHNTAQELPTSFQPCLSVYILPSLSFSLSPSPPCVCFSLSSLSSSMHPLHRRVCLHDEEKTSGRTYARIIRASAPRSLIVHRNRNCVLASHACGSSVPSVRYSSLFHTRSLKTLPSAPDAKILGSLR